MLSVDGEEKVGCKGRDTVRLVVAPLHTLYLAESAEVYLNFQRV